MLIDEIITGRDGPVFSFEFSPPKTDEGEANLRATLAQLRELEPAFASVTYGAGGSTRARTLEITKWLKADLGIEAMAHLTCVGASIGDLRRTLEDLAEAGIENVLALRGDPPQGATSWQPHPEGLRHAAELIDLARREFPALGVAAAAYPEVHPEATDPLTDLQHLKAKVDRGAGVLITQLFFDNGAYFRFVDAARFAGIEVPILPGIMPITNVAQIKRITGLCGASIPSGLLEQLEQRADDPESVAELGVAYATLQCAELLAHGAPGIHFYTLNRSPATRAILSALKLAHPAAAPKPVGG
ncbi:methylenetetrahydrofolate reductase [NAD(P)H] [Conexibacter sp. DBS9H8]|uniref:methylenetetrahydrofolate reductase [NAD(P)H] n=1 Tax=Conexibacter sp. DBS9H8 TaxID=2937801 RepID=UPI00200E1F28|nr:methylenetetrahydrofolate reductase [NAD(P)H] [Conexibacter sp. DBS9H8]